MSFIQNVKTKKEIALALTKVTTAVNTSLSDISKEDFEAPFGEKWSISDNLEHLILSNGSVAKALSIPKSKLAAKFGTPSRPSVAGDVLEKKYFAILKETQLKAPPMYSPNKQEKKSKQELLQTWGAVNAQLGQLLDNWKEEELETYQIPHPALGPITIRELLYSTIFHTAHHLKAIETIKSK